MSSAHQGPSVADALRLALLDAFTGVKPANAIYDFTEPVADAVLASSADSSIAPATSRGDILAAFPGATSSTEPDKTLTDDETTWVDTASDAFVAVAEGLSIYSFEPSALSTACEVITAVFNTRLNITATPRKLDQFLGGPGFGGGLGCGVRMRAVEGHIRMLD